MKNSPPRHEWQQRDGLGNDVFGAALALHRGQEYKYAGGLLAECDKAGQLTDAHVAAAASAGVAWIYQNSQSSVAPLAWLIPELPY